MTIPAKQSLSGFIATEPELGTTKNGYSRVRVRVGKQHWTKDDQGNWEELDPTYHNLVVFRKAAQAVYERFRPGDRFIAEGEVQTYSREIDGETKEFEEFVAKKVSFDTTVLPYTDDGAARLQAVNRSQGRVNVEHTTTAEQTTAQPPAPTGTQDPAPSTPVVQPHEMYV